MHLQLITTQVSIDEELQVISGLSFRFYDSRNLTFGFNDRLRQMDCRREALLQQGHLRLQEGLLPGTEAGRLVVVLHHNHL